MKFGDRLKRLFGMSILDDTVYEDLADLLVEGDLGPAFADAIARELRQSCAKEGVGDGNGARAVLKRLLAPYALAEDLLPEASVCVAGNPHVILLLGVNGVGKTTTAAKLASYYGGRGFGDGILLAAGDTFRAAAIEQLRAHGQRLGLRVVAQEQGSDPGAVLFDAIDAAKASGARLVFADTAGRMHTKQNLVKELEKLDKIVSAKTEPGRYRKLLVLDATTGQNALAQAEIFSDAVRIDGIVVTKYDSTARGGIILSIGKRLGLPCFFVCSGERYGDIRPFDPGAYLDDFTGYGVE